MGMGLVELARYYISGKLHLFLVSHLAKYRLRLVGEQTASTPPFFFIK